MTEFLENIPPLTIAGEVKSSPELDDEDRAEAGNTAIVVPIAQSGAFRTPPVDTRQRINPAPKGATGELFARIKQIIAHQTHLSDGGDALLTFWVFSTWLQQSLSLAPCLEIIGPAHEATIVLHTLKALCCSPLAMAGFNGAALKDFRWNCPTLLISEPNLGKRAAAFLGSSTNRGFLAMDGGYSSDYFGSKAVYMGEDSPLKSILHSIQINAVATPSAQPLDAHQLSEDTAKPLRNLLLQYRDRNLAKVGLSEFNPPGLSGESHAIATALGSCIVDSPELQVELVALLRPHAQQQIADRSDSIEALVVGASLALCHQGKSQFYVREVTAEVNRLQETRGETMQFSPEKIGHKLKKVGLFTRRLSQDGNGLAMDRATTIRLHEIAATYQREDSIEERGNLHCSLCSQNKGVEEVM